MNIYSSILIKDKNEKGVETLNKFLKAYNIIPVFREVGEIKDFASARNEGIKKIDEIANPDDWIFVVDLDERPQIRFDLHRFLSDIPASIGAFFVSIISPHVSRSMNIYVDKTTNVRLFRAKRGFRYKNNIHETIYDSIVENGYAVRRIDEDLVWLAHLGYDLTREEFYLKIKRNYDKTIALAKQNNFHVVAYYLANLHINLGNIAYAKTLLEAAFPFFSDELKEKVGRTIEKLNGLTNQNKENVGQNNS